MEGARASEATAGRRPFMPRKALALARAALRFAHRRTAKAAEVRHRAGRRRGLRHRQPRVAHANPRITTCDENSLDTTSRTHEDSLQAVHNPVHRLWIFGLLLNGRGHRQYVEHRYGSQRVLRNVGFADPVSSLRPSRGRSLRAGARRQRSSSRLRCLRAYVLSRPHGLNCLRA